MPVRNNNPRLPSCKTIVQEGKRGMRIKGVVNGKIANSRCKVRNIADAQGNVTVFNKNNEPKMKVKEYNKDHKIRIKHGRYTTDFVYDTGAMVTGVSRSTALRMGIIDHETSNISRYPSRPQNVSGVGGIRRGHRYSGVPLTLVATGETVLGDVYVPNDMERFTNLFGSNHMKSIKRYKMKFR